MHARELSQRRRLEVDVERLGLADKCAAISSEVEHFLLRDFPYGFIDGLDIIGDSRDVLDGAIMRDDHVLHLVVPEAEVDEFAKEPRADDLEFASEDTTCVDIAVDRPTNISNNKRHKSKETHLV